MFAVITPIFLCSMSTSNEVTATDMFMQLVMYIPLRVGYVTPIYIYIYTGRQVDMDVCTPVLYLHDTVHISGMMHAHHI